MPVFWAIVIAAIFEPLYEGFQRKFSRADLSASLTFAIVILIIVIPAFVVGYLLLAESVSMYRALGEAGGGEFGRQVSAAVDAVRHNAVVRRLGVDEGAWVAKISDVARGIADYILASLTSLTQNTLVFLLRFAVMLYTLFYFLRDGKKFRGIVKRLLPLDRGREEVLYDRFVLTARSTVKVTLIIGGVQGVFGALLFLLLGIQGALIWGVLMFLASVLPSGSVIIWAPVGVILILTGHVWEGVATVISCTLLIVFIDAYLRPRLVGRDIEMHPLLIFLSTFGGMAVFGISGFVIGPIVTALLSAIIEMYESDSRGEEP
jgi:predicted PurR-regulated permease PerM